MSRRNKPLEALAALNAKQRAYVEGVLSGKTKKQAALDAGYRLSTALNASTIEDKDVRRAFRELVRLVVPPEKITKRLCEGLDAVRIQPVVSKGKVIEKIEVPDYRERREYLALAAKYGGQYTERLEVATEELSDPERDAELMIQRLDVIRAQKETVQ